MEGRTHYFVAGCFLDVGISHFHVFFLLQGTFVRVVLSAPSAAICWGKSAI